MPLTTPSSLLPRQPLFLFLLLISQLLSSSHGDVGTATQYSPPYLRKYPLNPILALTFTHHSTFSSLLDFVFRTATTCFGIDPSQFPSNNLFAAAGDGIWDNGASCGREYLVRCISATVAGSCRPGQTIQVKIVDYALSTTTPPSVSGTTIVLSETAFGNIANSSANSINIEFQQV
ncbi:EG45-like domain containing protein 2 isoform X1 [Manihot esculenta]|uniref:EG45-like domain containing protein 2 isoform X1 n=1 Tax=Manihot esculenta TaxID=3983 RepID=UPI000B5D6E16|nr:EG45-like domain containing protein 2 isoform X1 [Manihot esculenta]